MKPAGREAETPSFRNADPARTAARGAGWKPLGMLAGGLAVLAALVFVSLTQGLANVSLRAVVDALFRSQDVAEHQLVLGVRLPRTVMGIIAGAGLAAAGALMQTVTRNPLASESTLGVNAGAYLVVVVGTIFFPGLLHEAPILFAVAGGAAAAAAVYAMGGGRKGTPARFALSGMIVTLVFSSITSALHLLFEETTQGLFLWGSGTLIQNDWSGARFAWPWVGAGLLLLVLASRHFDLLAFGDETARSLGQKVGATRFAGMALAVVLVCVIVSVVGPIGFVGLIAPHLVRLSGVARHAWLIPVSAVWGAAILVGSDTLARSVVSSFGELPAGAVTAIIGAPWLIWLALRVSRHAGARGSARSGVPTAPPGSWVRAVPYPAWVALLGALLLAVWAASLMSGSVRLSLAEMLAALAGGGDELHRSILLDMRLPRLLTAGLVGMALAVSGCLLQSSVRNPLADPQVVGVTSGAGVGALLLLIAFPQLPAGWLPFGAIAGGLAASGLVYAIAWRRGLSPTVLILVGIAVAAACSAVINILVLQAKLTLAPALAWMAGSTYARDWPHVAQMLPPVALLLPFAWWLGRRVDLLSFNDESSTGLGLPVRRTRLLAGAVAVVLASVSAANVGSIGFVGLLAPHAARLLVGANHRRSMVVAALLGGTLLVAADWVGRTVLSPREIPSGIVAAVMGAPYLFLLMMRSKKTTD